jgi:HAD superfamily hydrolase (TIGR01484 family)
MIAVSRLTEAEAQGLRGVLFDLDDTLLDGGLLTEQAYGALFRLAKSGLRLVAVTGRPSGYGEVMARQWPVAAVVTENGAVALHRDGAALRRWQQADEATRRARRIRIAQVFETLRGRFPEVRLSDDSHARTSDLALDIGETQRVVPEVVARIEAEARALGVSTFVSSVHLHLTLEPFDKASGTVAFLNDRYGEDPTAIRRAYAYVGDSANDAACFNAFATTFGVANIATSLKDLSLPPKYVASAAKGAGFCEIAERLVSLRSARPA